VRGHVSGDVTAFGGSIVVEDQGQVNGDASAFGGDIRIDKEAKVAHDVAVFGGRIRRDPAATVGGDVTTIGGPGWIFLIFLTPLIFSAIRGTDRLGNSAAAAAVGPGCGIAFGLSSQFVATA